MDTIDALDLQVGDTLVCDKYEDVVAGYGSGMDMTKCQQIEFKVLRIIPSSIGIDKEELSRAGYNIDIAFPMLMINVSVQKYGHPVNIVIEYHQLSHAIGFRNVSADVRKNIKLVEKL